MAKNDTDALIKQMSTMLESGFTKKQVSNLIPGGGYGNAKRGVYRARPKDIVRLAKKSKKRGGKLPALVNTGDALDNVAIGTLTRARGIRIPDVRMHVNPAGQLAAAPTQGAAKPKKARKKRPGKAYRNWAAAKAKKPAKRKAKKAGKRFGVNKGRTAKPKGFKPHATAKPRKAAKAKRKARFAKGSPAAIAWGKKMAAARAAGKKPAKRKAAKKATRKAARKPAKRKVGNARKSIRKSSAAKKRTYKGARYMTKGENKSAKRMRAKPLRESYAGPRAFGRS